MTDTIKRYIADIWGDAHGDRYRTILRYFFPALVTSFILYFFLIIFDAYLVAKLASTSTYVTLGASKSIVHWMTKVAEGMAVSVTILCGQYNGAGHFSKAGRSFVDAFWVIVLVGAVISLGLFVGAPFILCLMGMPAKVVSLGVPLLRLRAIGVFLSFAYFAIIAFLSGVKNTRTPMQIYLIGAAIFVFFDYGLILGNFGMPALGLLGSAWATIIQHVVMLTLAIGYIVSNPDYLRYGIHMLQISLQPAYAKRILQLGWPVVVDKAIFALAYIWLNSMMAPMGKYALASYDTIRNMEALAFLPAMAFAQVVTFLISNRYSQGDWQGIKATLRKVLVLAIGMVYLIILALSLESEWFIAWFDLKGTFTSFASGIFPFVSLLVAFDIVQVIASGALRGAADVRWVMWLRICACVLFFAPVSYLLAHAPIADNTIKFLLVYGSFYVNAGIMAVACLVRLRGNAWKKYVQ